MPIDPSIIAGLKSPAPVTTVDPMERYGQAVQLKALLGQGQLQDTQLQLAQQGLADDQATRSAYQQSGGDPVKLRQLLNGAGQYKAVQAFDKNQLDVNKSKSEISKNDAETFDKTVTAYKPLIASAQTPEDAKAIVTAQYNDPVLGPHLKQAGSLQDLLNRIPLEPQQFNGWKTQQVNGMEAYNTSVQQRANATETARHNSADEKTAQQRVGIEGGNLNLARQRFAFDQSQPKGQYDAANGVVVDTRTGQATPVINTATGQPMNPAGKGFNESQGKAAGMALRATKANTILNSLEDSGVTNRGLIKQAAGTIPLVGGAAEMGVNSLPGILGGPSGQQQQVEQARRDFVNAVLRVESGASISPSEFANAEKQYFPMPGDSAGVMQQKRANRQTAIDSLNIQTGPNGAKMQPPTAAAGVHPSNLSDDELKRQLGIH